MLRALRTSRSYDAKGRLASLNDPSSGTIIPNYDLNDNITNVTSSDGTSTAFAYDAVNRVTETTDALGIVRRVAYDVRDASSPSPTGAARPRRSPMTRWTGRFPAPIPPAMFGALNMMRVI